MKPFAICLVAICSLFSQEAFGQIKDKMFHSIGYSFPDIYRTPPKTTTTIEYGDTSNYYDYITGVSYASFVYTLRFNVYEPTDEMALAVSLSPSLGLLSFGTFGSGSSSGFFQLSVPLYFTAEFGAGSTYSSTGNVGGVIGVGAEFMKAPLILMDVYRYDNEDEKTIKSAWFQPTFYTAIRYWSKKNRMREIFLRGGFGPKGEVNDLGETKRAFTARLGFVYILNY